jgi:hypothetical protein
MLPGAIGERKRKGRGSQPRSPRPFRRVTATTPSWRPRSRWPSISTREAGIGVDRGFEIDPHRRTIVVERRLPGSLAENGRHASQRKLRRQMRNGIDMNFKRSRETTKILASFQQRCQRQSTSIAAGSCPDESMVGFAYAVSVIQFLSCQFFTRTWGRRYGRWLS